MYLWRAVDSEGEVLDILVQSRRNKKAALKLMRKLLKKQGYAPNKVVTDKLPSYGAALRDLNMTGKHVTGGRSNNRAENSHLPVRRRISDIHRILSAGVFDPCTQLIWIIAFYDLLDYSSVVGHRLASFQCNA